MQQPIIWRECVLRGYPKSETRVLHEVTKREEDAESKIAVRFRQPNLAGTLFAKQEFKQNRLY